MQHSKIVTLVAMLVLCATFVGCGGGSSNTNSSTSATAAPTPTSVAYAEQNALPLTVAAKIPPGLKCATADTVWANMHTKAYHDPGDPYYGKTKNGAYMCKETAVAQGFHAAGAAHSRHTHMMTTPTSPGP